MARQILKNAIQCPFCGCTKIFLKAETVKYSDIDDTTKLWTQFSQIRASGQCSKCHIRGPFVYSKRYPVAHVEIDDEFLEQVLAKWNTRCP